MQDRVLAALRCPVCGLPLAREDGGLACARRHHVDLARQGYANLLRGPAPAAADTAEMVAARARVQATGLHAPVAAALRRAVIRHAPGSGLVVDVGAGTGGHLATVLDALPGTVGLAVDLSKHAARRAARVHPRADAIVADVWAGLPLVDGAAEVLLDVFAPRDADELARVVRPGGVAVVVTPRPDHLAPLVDALGLLRVDAGKAARVVDGLEECFACVDAETVAWEAPLDAATVVDLVGMGPSAHHVEPAALAARVAGLTLPVRVRLAVDVRVLRRR